MPTGLKRAVRVWSRGGEGPKGGAEVEGVGDEGGARAGRGAGLLGGTMPEGGATVGAGPGQSGARAERGLGVCLGW